MIVTHNMQQAARVSDWTLFMLFGEVVEFGPTQEDLHGAGRSADGGLRDGAVRLMTETRSGSTRSSPTLEREILEMGELAATAVQRAGPRDVAHDDGRPRP